MMEEPHTIHVRGFRKRPIRSEIGTETDKKNPMSLLRNAVVGSIRLMDVNAVSQTFASLTIPLLMALKSGKVLIPARILR